MDSLSDCGTGGVGFRGVDWKAMRIEVVFRCMNLGETPRDMAQREKSKKNGRWITLRDLGVG